MCVSRAYVRGIVALLSCELEGSGRIKVPHAEGVRSVLRSKSGNWLALPLLDDYFGLSREKWPKY